MSVQEWVRKIASSIGRVDPLGPAKEIEHQYMLGKFAQSRIAGQSELSLAIGRAIEEPYKETCTQLLLRTEAFRNGKMQDAYTHQAHALNAFLQIFKTDSNWSAPILQTIMKDLRKISFEADQELAKIGKKKEKVDDAGRLLMTVFAICNSDRAALEESKKWATIKVVNELLRLYFANDALHMCKPLIRSTEALSASVPFESLKMADRVTYCFFTGRLAALDDELQKGEQLLDWVFKHSPKSAKINKRQVLVHLIPVRLLAGVLPSAELLKANDLEAQFADLSEAVQTGRIDLLHKSLVANEEFYMVEGIFLTIEKLKSVIYRNLFRRIVRINAPETRIPLHYFHMGLQCMGTELEYDEVECIVANLIAGGFMKGYISHQHGKIVLSKEKAFPPLRNMIK